MYLASIVAVAAREFVNLDILKCTAKKRTIESQFLEVNTTFSPDANFEDTFKSTGFGKGVELNRIPESTVLKVFSPSIHRLRGVRYDMELQFQHKNDLMVSFLVKANTTSNNDLNGILSDLKNLKHLTLPKVNENETQSQRESKIDFTPLNDLFNEANFVSYNGTDAKHLNKAVRYVVVEQVISAREDQIFGSFQRERAENETKKVIQNSIFIKDCKKSHLFKYVLIIFLISLTLIIVGVAIFCFCKKKPEMVKKIPIPERLKRRKEENV